MKIALSVLCLSFLSPLCWCQSPVGKWRMELDWKNARPANRDQEAQLLEARGIFGPAGWVMVFKPDKTYYTAFRGSRKEGGDEGKWSLKGRAITLHNDEPTGGQRLELSKDGKTITFWNTSFPTMKIYMRRMK